jgi:nicotinate-nucleotide adenylyltransferase
LPVPEVGPEGAQEAEPAERVGIFGGTFDPPHVGHAAAARAIVDALDLDRLLLVVANDPWQKSPTRPITPAEDRFALTQALTAAIPGTEASRLEIDRGGPSYSIDTVEALLAEAAAAGRPRPVLFLVVGADLVPELDSWERAADLAGLVRLAVVSRPTTPRPAVPAGWDVVWVDGPQVDVSSSAVREALAQGGRIDGMVPPDVIHCIARRGLYAVGR